ncbi:hypothetical protein [Sphingopyxis sp. YF1]|jgi:hypothetical protein|nr:hypothetical protein [Sphingopyxis sp. YF1]
MEPEYEQRSGAGRRRADRRKAVDPNYTGPERRSGVDRRSATDRRAAVRS